MEKYIKVKENAAATHIRIRVHYDLGGISWATYQPKPRGYYIIVTPVRREVRDGVAFESFTAFTGVSQLVHPVSRKSAKAEGIALEKAAAIEKTMIDWVCQDQGLELEV